MYSVPLSLSSVNTLKPILSRVVTNVLVLFIAGVISTRDGVSTGMFDSGVGVFIFGIAGVDGSTLKSGMGFSTGEVIVLAPVGLIVFGNGPTGPLFIGA